MFQKKYRKIVRANVGHGYTAKIFDENLKQLDTKTLEIEQTKVRLRNGSTHWEETVEGAPGWWRCDPPKGSETINEQNDDDEEDVC